MDPEIWKFLTKFHTNSDNYNFSGQLSPWLGKFNVERLDLDNFWKIYCDSVIKNPTLVYGIGERPNECLPLLADIDLDTKFNLSNNLNLDEKESKFLNDDKTFKKLYSIEDVRIIVLAHQYVIKEISKQWKPINCPCLLLEKDHPYYKEGKLKGGFHLHFPKLWIRNCDYDIHILPRVVKYLNDRHPNLFKYLGEDKEPGLYIDPKVCSKHWLLYGSGKSKESSVYRVTTAFDHEGREIAIEDALAGYKLLDARGNQINLTQENIRYYLPRILSTHPANKTTLVLKTNLECAIKMAIETAEERTAHHESEDTVGDVQMMRELMEFISPTRADYYDSWFEMACVMYCIGDGCQEAFDMFSDFSSKTTRDNYDETKCLYLWKKLSNSHKYTIGTLKYYANQDSPEKYDAWKKKKQSEYIKLDGQINHYDLACMLKTAYANTFLSTIVNDKVAWFEYADHRWTRSEKGLALRAKISVELVQKFSDEMSKIYKELQDNTDQDRGAELAQLKKAVKSLKTSNFKSAVMTECIEVFNKPKFFKLLDADINLLGFTNGVLDLKNLVFRPGKPEDYISMSTGFDFQEYSESDPDYLEVINFLEKVFPDPSLRTYFIEYCAYLLRGGNTNKVFLNMTGSGDNAKSIVIMLLELCLGDYCIKFPTSLITGKRTQSAQASPELARSQGVRFAIVQEPDKKEIINDGIIKELTGNDSFFARGLFQDGGEIKPMFKLALVCVSGDAKINLSCGISIALDKLITNKQNIIAWNAKDGLVSTVQQEFLDRGEKECIELTFLDGRTVKCTPDHKFLSYDGQWIEAQDIKINDTPITMGCHNPDCNDIFDTYTYKFENGITYNMNKLDDKIKASAFFRILGYLLTDGREHKRIYLGHMLDVEAIQEDIQLLTGQLQIPKLENNTYRIDIPDILTKEYHKVVQSYSTDKMNTEYKLPECIFDNDIPLFIVREFIAGLFGGDGIIPCLVRNSFKHTQLMASRTSDFVDTIVNEFNKLSLLLKKRFNIESYVTKPVPYEEDKYNVFLVISKQSSLLKFIDNIGVRYCCHKSYRYECVSSFLHYKQAIINQNKQIIERVKELRDIYERQNIKPLIVQIDKDSGNIIKKYNSTQEAQNATEIRHSGIKSACDRSETGKKGTSGGFIWRYEHRESEKLEQKGYATVKDALDSVKSELNIIDSTYSITYSQIRSHYITYGNEYKSPFIKIKPYLIRTKLDRFCNDGKKAKYSVSRDMNSLPVYQSFVIGKRSIGKEHVYDITVKEPFSSFVANGAVVHNCNKLLRLSGGDPAMWARIDVLPFESRFPKNASEVPDSVEEQFRKKIFPRDPNFADKLPKLRQPFMWLLFQTYKELRKKGPTPKPPKVLSATDEYKRANDITLQYITERVTVDNTKTLSINEVYSDFVEWFKLTFTSIKPPNRNELLEELTSRWGVPTETGRWKYKRLKTTRDELHEGSALLYADQKKSSNEDLEVDPSTFTQEISNDNNTNLESKENIIQNDIEIKNDNLVSDTEQLNNNTSSNESCNESSNDTGDSDSEDRIKRVQGLLRQKYKIKVIKNEKNDK